MSMGRVRRVITVTCLAGVIERVLYRRRLAANRNRYGDICGAKHCRRKSPLSNSSARAD